MFNYYSNKPSTKVACMKYGLLLLAALLSSSSFAQEDIQQTITQKDAAFWKAYNNCEIDSMELYIAEDIEFYHDKGGTTMGREALSNSLKDGLCRTGSNYLRREAVPGSVSIYPLKDKDSVYGAIITGEHLFYIKNGKSERLDGQAKFSHLWLQKNGEWKMHRVFSFDHGPARYKNPKQTITLTSEELEIYTGEYRTSSNALIIVDTKDGHLQLSAMGKTFVLFPDSKNSFYTKDRDLTFKFSEENGRKLEIFESEKKVEEATFLKN